MAISWQASGSPAYSASSGATSISVSLPASIAAGNLLILHVGQKPITANGGAGVSAPAGWTLSGYGTGGGYGSTLAADTGNTNLWAFTRVADGSETSPITVNLGSDSDVVWAQVTRYANPTGNWDIGNTWGEWTTGGNVAMTFTGSPGGITSGDFLVGAFCIPTDINTSSNFSSETLAATGATINAASEISEKVTSIGNDIAGVNFFAAVTSGSSSDFPTFATVSTGTTTNIRGPAVLLRLRDAVPTSPKISVSIFSGARARARRLLGIPTDPMVLTQGSVVSTTTTEYARSLADSLSFSDVVTKYTTHARTLSDSFTITDVITRSAARTLTEALSFTDSIVRSLIYPRNLSDSLTFRDVVEAKRYYFTPPTAVRHPVTAEAGGRLFSLMSLEYGLSVLKKDGFYTLVENPTNELVGASDKAYLGGHTYEVSQAEATALTDAGYGGFITNT